MDHLPSPTEIQYFMEVAKSGNMSRAAERLGLRQPTLSVSLSKLENNLGAKLLVRSKKGVTLTDEGMQFLQRAQELLRLWSELKTQTREQGREVRGHIRLGCHVSVALYTLSGFMPNVMKVHPQLDFSFTHDFSRKIVEDVISMRLDIGIVVNPVRHPDLLIKKLCEDEVAFWKTAECLYPGTLISDQNLNQTQTLIQKSKKRGFEKFITTSSLEVARDLAEGGVGVAILPTRVAQSGKHSVLRKISALPVFKDEICLIMRVEQRNNPSMKFLSEQIAGVFAD